jgi:hypothetical protein
VGPSLEDADYAFDEGEDQELDFWGKMWRAAGYVPAANGNYVRAEGGIVGGKLSDAEMLELINREVDAQENALARMGSTASSNRSRATLVAAPGTIFYFNLSFLTPSYASSNVKCNTLCIDPDSLDYNADQEKLIEFARVADAEKANQLVRDCAHVHCCIYVCMFTYIHKCLFTNIHICICIHMCMCVCMCVCLHTRIGH